MDDHMECNECDQNPIEPLRQFSFGQFDGEEYGDNCKNDANSEYRRNRLTIIISYSNKCVPHFRQANAASWKLGDF